jgi:hypothetical protein
MKKVGILYGHLEYITAIRYILWPLGKFGIFPIALVYRIKKNLATLAGASSSQKTIHRSPQSLLQRLCMYVCMRT